MDILKVKFENISKYQDFFKFEDRRLTRRCGKQRVFLGMDSIYIKNSGPRLNIL